MVNAGTFSSGAAALSLGLSVHATLLAQTFGALLLVLGLTLNAAPGVKSLGVRNNKLGFEMVGSLKRNNVFGFDTCFGLNMLGSNKYVYSFGCLNFDDMGY